MTTIMMDTANMWTRTTPPRPPARRPPRLPLSSIDDVLISPPSESERNGDNCEDIESNLLDHHHYDDDDDDDDKDISPATPSMDVSNDRVQPPTQRTDLITTATTATAISTEEEEEEVPRTQHNGSSEILSPYDDDDMNYYDTPVMEDLKKLDGDEGEDDDDDDESLYADVEELLYSSAEDDEDQGAESCSRPPPLPTTKPPNMVQDNQLTEALEEILDDENIYYDAEEFSGSISSSSSTSLSQTTAAADEEPIYASVEDLIAHLSTFDSNIREHAASSSSNCNSASGSGSGVVTATKSPTKTTFGSAPESHYMDVDEDDLYEVIPFDLEFMERPTPPPRKNKSHKSSTKVAIDPLPRIPRSAAAGGKNSAAHRLTKTVYSSVRKFIPRESKTQTNDKNSMTNVTNTDHDGDNGHPVSLPPIVASQYSVYAMAAFRDLRPRLPTRPTTATAAATAASTDGYESDDDESKYMNFMRTHLTRSLYDKAAAATASREEKILRKRQHETERARLRFHLTGDEIPVNAGLIKEDTRGSSATGDLKLKSGEMALILRMENCPPGKWIAKSERGQIGYVDLSNLAFDPETVKAIMLISPPQCDSKERQQQQLWPHPQRPHSDNDLHNYTGIDTDVHEEAIPP